MNTIPMLRHAVVALTLVLGAAALPAPLHAAPAVPATQTRLLLAASAVGTNASGTNAVGAVNSLPVRAQTRVLVGGVLQDVVGNRSRLIQVSFVAILIGIFILWKK
jgi:hypothetical protein